MCASIGMTLETDAASCDGMNPEAVATSTAWGTAQRGRVRTWSDKLVAEVVRLLLEAYYDVQFSDRSHGFRPGRGCHTALSEVVEVWKGTHWFIEGDISDCFGSLDHQVMGSILAEKIYDGRFLRLVSNMLTAGYLQDWRWHATLSGAPQGGVASPILSNIYLDRLDTFVEKTLLPEYHRGVRRRRHRAYQVVVDQIAKARRHGDRAAVRLLTQRRRRIPSQDPNDLGYRRLRYVRYADDWLLGFAGPRHEAEQIKTRIATFLHDQLKLELSPSKTLITHATSQAARFLGYEIKTQHSDTKITRGRRAVNGLTVHHLRKLADLNRHDRPDKPAWVHLMAKRRRKTLVICRTCHEDIHAGRTRTTTRN
jgi:retron-type reverse transcriptase